MLLSIGTSVSAAQADAPKPTEVTEVHTMEDILSDYHDQVFGLESLTDSNANTRSTQTVESIIQDTEDELQSAGYEAYHVNSNTYAYVEDILQNDLSAMGIDAGDDYIIIVSGEENDIATGTNNSRIIDDSIINPDPSIKEDEHSGMYFTYNGVTYRMRYLTVTGEAYTKADDVDLIKRYGESFIRNLINTAVTYLVEKATGSSVFGIVASLFGLDITSSYTNKNSSLIYQAGATWVRTYIEIFDEEESEWVTTAYSEYADVTTICSGIFYNNSTRSIGSYSLNTDDRIYSDYYHDTTQRKMDAVRQYLGSGPNYDRTGNLKLKFEFEDGSIKTVITLGESF